MSMIINKLPSITWNRLKVNSTSVDINIEKGGKFISEVPSDISLKVREEVSDKSLENGMGAAFNDYITSLKLPVHSFFVAEKSVVEEPIRLKFAYDEVSNVGNIIELHMAKDSQATVIMDYSAVKDLDSVAAVQTRVHLEDNAKLTLIQIQLIDKELTFFNDIAANCAKGAEFELTQIIIGDKATYQGSKVLLAGDDSVVQANVAYLVRDNDKLDMNYIAVHEGKLTTSRLYTRGVLRDKAEKTFRGTIDIKLGAANASGQESETVLLIDEGVVNKTIPIILCAEEDVEGAHGATIGRLDEELMFYMKARGFSEKAIYELMARARIEEVCNFIEDEATRKLVEDFMGGE